MSNSHLICLRNCSAKAGNGIEAAENTDRNHALLQRFRTVTAQFVKDHAGPIGMLFQRVSPVTSAIETKISRVAVIVEKLGEIDATSANFRIQWAKPVLACLDPQRRFPIMNDGHRSVARYWRKPDAKGLVALYSSFGCTM